MRVLIAADIFPPVSGGPATYSSLLLSELPKLGHEVEVVAQILERLPDESAHVFRVRHSFLPLRYCEYYRLLKRRGRAADVIYAMGPVNAGFPAWLAARSLHKPFVTKVVGDYAWEQGVARWNVKELPDEFKNKRYGIRVSMLRMVERFVCRRARLVIVPSMYLKRMVEGWGVNAAKIKVIYNAAPAIGSNTACEDEYANKRFIFSAGRLMPWKGMDTLIELMPQLLLNDPALHLVIAGDGPERTHLDAVVARLKLEHVVTLLGNVTAQEMHTWFGRALVFVLNSGYEGMSHLLLEAFAAGCPVAVSNACGNPEVVEDGKTGLLFSYNDREGIKKALLRLLNDSVLRERCIAGGKEKIAQLSQKTMLSQTITALQSAFPTSLDR